MATRERTLEIAVDGRTIAGTLIAPDTRLPGVMLVHGWDGSQVQYLARARALAAMGCICLTFDLRGHARDKAHRATVTREENLRDMLAAYDLLAAHPAVDSNAMLVVGSSYGGYLAAVMSALRPVRWLALRVPALYQDDDWLVPKQQLSRTALAQYRAQVQPPGSNRALAASHVFSGDVLLVESECDDIVPHPTIESYRSAFGGARSMTYSVIKGADHSLARPEWSESYSTLLLNWFREMLGNAAMALPLPLR